VTTKKRPDETTLTALALTRAFIDEDWDAARALLDEDVDLRALVLDLASTGSWLAVRLGRDVEGAGLLLAAMQERLVRDVHEARS
jgi:hypothetical protein